MPQTTMLGSARNGRYYVRVPKESVAEIEGYIKGSGIYQAAFLSNALVVGARQIAQQHPSARGLLSNR